MLHENPLMVDANVDHWRNLQSLLLELAKGKSRIIVIHEDGEILKFVHSRKAEIVRPVERIDDPHVAAKAIYDANPALATSSLSSNGAASTAISAPSRTRGGRTRTSTCMSNGPTP